MNEVLLLLPGSCGCELKHSWIQPCWRVHCFQHTRKPIREAKSLWLISQQLGFLWDQWPTTKGCQKRFNQPQTQNGVQWKNNKKTNFSIKKRTLKDSEQKEEFCRENYKGESNCFRGRSAKSSMEETEEVESVNKHRDPKVFSSFFSLWMPTPTTTSVRDHISFFFY